ncbi:PREDICTED: methylsterol monooxygenase 1-like [Ceratosolen solmsi marchali]|uniref:Methylsterol monooxygenase 1-like n=1 Tax=Ceratosolen solmsi marchali TaxID=326594 RepID=A0AAJ6YK67_9HYME|nr:PREDICTED: methylsterol monooxygenase 1-like [Ceratosolen solmsi marchali]
MVPKSGHEVVTADQDDESISTQKESKEGVRDSMVVRWLNKQVDKMDKHWTRLPSFAGSAAATCAIFLLGLCYRGEWMLIFVHFARRFGYGGTPKSVSIALSNDTDMSRSMKYGWELLLSEAPYLRHFSMAWMVSLIISYSIYFSICSFFHWYYYVRQRDKAEEWKCQPYKWLSPKLEKHEIILGIFSLFCTNTFTAAFATYVLYGGPSMIYFGYDEYTLLWWFLQWPIMYIILDYETYWFHRLYHRPTLYKMFHKLHHTYKQPTAWSVTAIHPIEIMHMQLCYLVPLFIMPSHLIPYCTIMIYNFYHGLIDHSGINFKAQWWQPWQPDASFHDNHHQYTHVNFGFNMFYWDKLHGTYRLKDRIYNENTFFGKGKKLSEATKEELAADFQERNSENVDNKVIYCLRKNSITNTKTD